MKLLAIHVQHGAIEKEHGDVVQGALNYKEMKVGEVMTPLEDVFMLSKHARLDFKTIREIFQQGFSRIPVYGHDREDILGLLLVKDLIFIDPEDATPVENFIKVFGRAVVGPVWEDQKLDEVLREFKKGAGHMAVVKDVDASGPGDPVYVMKGIITLEDIVEEIVGEIVDETDVFVDVDNRVKVDRAQFDYSRLRLLDSQLVSESLDPAELAAIAAHLRANVAQFAEKTRDLPDAEVRNIVNASSVLELARQAPPGAQPLPDDVLYRRGKVSANCTLVLTGKLAVLAGKDAFHAEAGPWTVLGAEALSMAEGDYIPDFTAYIESDHVRVVRVPLKEIEDARRRHDEGTGGGAADATTEEDVGVGENGGATKKRPGLGMRQPSQRTLQQQRRAARAVARRADAKRRPTKDASRADCETDTEHPGEESIRQPSPRSRSMPPARFLDAVTRRSRKEDKKSLLTAEDSDLTDVERGRGDSTSDVDGPVKNGNDRADFGAVQMRENPASALRRPSGVPGFPATDPLGRQPTVDVTVSDDDAPDM